MAVSILNLVFTSFQHGLHFKIVDLNCKILCLFFLQLDKAGRLKLETVDDLFNILQLKKRKRVRRLPVKQSGPIPVFVVRVVSLSNTYRPEMEELAS